MRWSRFEVGSFVFLVAAMLLATAWPAAVRADQCRAGCADDKHTCSQAARTAYRSCNMACETTDSRGDCRVACRGQFLEARRLCHEEQVGCRESCFNDPMPPSCRHCERELRECLADVLETGRSCAPACMPDQARGKGRRSIIRTGGCLHQCAEAMTQSAEACHEAHVECREMCGVGSASAAFLAPTPSLLD